MNFSHKTHLLYRNYEVGGKYGIAASLNEDGDGTASAWSVDGGQIGLRIMFGFIFGGISRSSSVR